MKFIEMLRRFIGSEIAISSFKSIFSFDIEFLIVSERKKNELTQKAIQSFISRNEVSEHDGHINYINLILQ